MHKMDALNLEMSSTFKAGQISAALQQPPPVFIEKGRLLDSLDLNTGFDAFQAAKAEPRRSGVSGRIVSQGESQNAHPAL
mmetsp:Transcript_2130/g.2736  ORF Transcript_2130/g.2736 Transcript_2130/m.2736 type:complete len:80 (+) Transcript_2130:301-540(+)